MEFLVCSQIITAVPPKPEYDDTFSQFSNRPVLYAPVITFYGKTRDCQKVSVHIHKVIHIKFYPKFYVEIPNGYSSYPQEFCLKLESLFDQNQPIIIHRITEEYRLSIYGFQSQRTRFFRIEVYNAAHIKKLSEICIDGFDGFCFQPYEAHIDTFQHFYAEYGITGMGWLAVNDLNHRQGSASLGFPFNKYSKSTKSSIECDTSIDCIPKSAQYVGSEFGNITLTPVYKIWKKESENRLQNQQSVTERMPEIPKSFDFPQDYSRHPEFRRNLSLVKGMPSTGLDFLMPRPRIIEPELQLNFEDDQQLIDDVLDISKPKGLIESPVRSTGKIKEMLKTPYFQSIDRMMKKAETVQIREFYFGCEEVRMNFKLQYKWKPEPPSYTSVKEKCRYETRTVNQKVFISNRTGEIISGITDPKVVYNPKVCYSPDFALDLATLPSKNDLYSNQYLYALPPPSFDLVFLESTLSSQQSHLNPTMKNIEILPAVVGEKLPLSIMYIEVFARSRAELLPDPGIDSVLCVAIVIRDDMGVHSEKIIQLGQGFPMHRGKYTVSIQYVPSEVDILRSVADEILKADCDVIISYEAEKSGIGYLIKRSKRIFPDFASKASRQKDFIVQQTYRYKKLSSLLPGRIILSCWRLIKGETHFYSYSIQNVVYSCLQARIPFYSSSVLTQFSHTSLPELYDYIWSTLYYSKVLVEHYGILERNVSLAQIYGIDYESVFTRGSQFRVEAMLKKQINSTDFLLLSATKQQVESQSRLEAIPLVLEPPKKFWTDPVIVLDFQSLYPSVMIAHNLCYSTCLGKIKAQNSKKFGVTHMRGDVFTDDDILITPNNVGFVKKNIREGFIPLMMHELLQTRIMIKNSMKNTKKDSGRYQKLFAQQLGIKLLCNTTYGYAGAGETGRMPCSDIADSIVAISRKTLEDAIRVVSTNKDWDAKVIYGDTDSMMVLLEGRTVHQAFTIGKEIADTITSRNPKPIELLLEKVYYPMITLAKKHYAGMKYEKPDSTPYFDARGIETVRTDYCPLSSNILKGTLMQLFTTRDLSKVHEYLTNEWRKVLANRYPLKDFILYEKVILGEYKNPPPGVKVSYRNIEVDKMRKPLFGENVGYVTRAGEPGTSITDLAMDPADFMSSHTNTLNIEYYMEKQINAVLDRTLSPIGVDVKSWYKQIPKKNTPITINSLQPKKMFMKSNNKRIDKFFDSALCIVCRRVMKGDICEACNRNPQNTVLAVMGTLNKQEGKLMQMNMVCRACCGSFGEVRCESLDCPVFYARIRLRHDVFTMAERMKKLAW